MTAMQNFLNKEIWIDILNQFMKEKTHWVTWNRILTFHNWLLVDIIKLILKFRFLPSFSEFEIYYGKIPPVFLYFGAGAKWILLRWPPFLPIHAHALHRLAQWVQIFSVVAWWEVNAEVPNTRGLQSIKTQAECYRNISQIQKKKVRSETSK